VRREAVHKYVRRAVVKYYRRDDAMKDATWKTKKNSRLLSLQRGASHESRWVEVKKGEVIVFKRMIKINVRRMMFLKGRALFDLFIR
jgi:hypothetical protein